MYLTAASDRNPSMLLIEGSLTLIAIAAAFAWPLLGSASYSRIEQAFDQLARKKGLAVATVGLATIILRLAILPFSPIPIPFTPDDFSFLLAADTFAHGRLTNPTPTTWVHFESVHITMRPTYVTMYFPGQGLLLAAGKLLLGHPWYAVLISSALMCASQHLLDVAGVDAAWLGSSRRVPGDAAPGPLQLVGEFVYRRC